MTQTVKDALVDALQWKGVFPDEAREIFAEFEASTSEIFRPLYGDPLSACGNITLISLERALDRVAVRWLDQHRPDHHARRNFGRG